MKPFRIFIFGAGVLFSTLIITVTVQKFKPSVLGYVLKVPVLTRSTSEPLQPASHILSLSRYIETTEKNDSDLEKKTALRGVDTLVVQPFEYSATTDTVLYSAFRELRNLASGHNLVRILHYGDSQIEGDRITSYLRNQLQLKFGGCGVGLIPVVALEKTSMSYVCETSKNWKRYSIRTGNHNVNRQKLGALMSFSKFEDEKTAKINDNCEGWICLKRSSLAFSRSQSFQQCRIFYGYNASPMMISAQCSQKVVDAEIVPSSNKLEVLKWNLESPENFTISFKTSQSPDVYGIALDGLSGVAVDNIPMRGSAGLDFTKVDLAFLKSFYEKLNIKLLILQFGANVAPSFAEHPEVYETLFRKELATLKAAIPGIAIIVIGVNDLSYKDEDGYESYPNIEKIRNAQRAAAFANRCAFWDLYQAMGGELSMQAWVLASPPLAKKDFTHFTSQGAKIVGEMFFRAFIKEYQKFETAN
jgi:hypothetical protein